MGRFFLTTLLQQIADMVGYAKIHTEMGARTHLPCQGPSLRLHLLDLRVAPLLALGGAVKR